MSFFQSGPYQSRILGSIVRQTRRWIDQGAIALRRLKIAASWSAQILLYPVYAVFQVARLASATVQSVAETGLPLLRSRVRQPLDKQEPLPNSNSFTADRAIQQALLTVQQLLLPIRLPVCLPQQATSDSGSVSLTLSAADELTVGLSEDVVPAPSTPTAHLSSVSRRGSDATSPAFIRGIASDVETRAIVLVTNYNQVLNLLTAEQQQILQRRIDWETTHYQRYLRLRQTTRYWLSRFAPAKQDRSLRPGRVLQQLAAWVQSDGVQQAGVSVWQFLESGWSRLQFPLWGSAKLPWKATQPALPASSTVDVPIQQALLTVQRLALLGELPALVTCFESGMSLDQATQLATSGNFSLSAVEQSFEVAAVESEDAMQPAARSPILIRGIASDVTTRAIVLVTSHNQILDLLTPEQQHTLRQRIAWDVACYGRYLNVRRMTQRVFSRLRLPSQPNHLLPPVRAFRGLMAWMQTSPVAIAINLFREASLPLTTPESIKVPPMLPQGNGVKPLRPIVGGFARPVALLSRVAAFVALPFQPTQAPLDVSGGGALTLTASSSILVADSTSGTPVEARLPLRATAKLPPMTQLSSSEPSPAARSAIESQSSDYIEAEASLLGYEQSLLERVLRWLDRILLWIESAIVAIWRQLR